MATYRYPLIAREGWLPIASLVALGAAAWHLSNTLAALLAFGMAVALIYLFRDPPRAIPSLPLAVLSPVDGRVVSVEPATDPWLNRDAIRIRLAINPLGTFSIRSPVEGRIVRQWFPDHGEGPADYGLWIQTDKKDDITAAVAHSRLSTRRYCQGQSGERIGQGQRCGFMLFGGQIDLFTPASCRIALKPGERVESGLTALGTLVHKNVTE